jgi:D-alanyl-lipoteichoic acid acyltransferase DltB (MBOAT superfamily)
MHNASARMKHALSFLIAILFGESILGLWHGANWTFVAFGLYHGFFILLYYFTRKWWEKVPSVLQMMVTFVSVSASFVFFRAGGLSEVKYIFSNLFNDVSFSVSGTFIGIGWDNLVVAFVCIFLIACLEFFEERQMYVPLASQNHPNMVWVLYGLFTAIILIFGMFQQMPFIYFQF